MPDTVDTVTCAPDDGWRHHPKHVEKFADINKLYIVAFCWTIIDTYYTMHGPLNIKKSQRKNVNIINSKFRRQNIIIDVIMNLHYSFVTIKRKTKS